MSTKLTMDEFAEKLKEKADTNKDGVTDFFEMVKVIASNPKFIFLAVALILAEPLFAFAKTGVQTGTWSWGQMLTDSWMAIFAFLLYFIQKIGTTEFQKVIKEMFGRWKKREEDLLARITKLEDESKKIWIENTQLTISLNLKESYMKDFMIAKNGNTEIFTDKIAASVIKKLEEK